MLVFSLSERQFGSALWLKAKSTLLFWPTAPTWSRNPNTAVRNKSSVIVLTIEHEWLTFHNVDHANESYCSTLQVDSMRSMVAVTAQRQPATGRQL